MQIANFNLEEKVLVVAEIGNNHEGNFEVAKELVRKAAECGVDAVKFQTFQTEHYVSRSDVERFRRLKSFELSYEQFAELARLARTLNLLFFSTPFDLASAEFLESVVDAYKIASGDNNFYPLIAYAAHTGKPMIISTGASDFQQVLRTVNFVKQLWAENQIAGQLAMLHCVSSYPVPIEQANLRAIQFMAERLDCPVGYSDHTAGSDAAVVAVAFGARIIEKHFTLDCRYSDFRDHQLSADPAAMRQLVERVRAASLMLGEYAKQIQPCEESAVSAIRRGVVAGADLPAGHTIASSDLTWVRPVGPLAPGEEQVLIGKTLNHSVQFGDRLSARDVE
jgi:N,N'-diacetyllegionaminate synthase